MKQVFLISLPLFVVGCGTPSEASAPVCLTSILWPEVFTSETRPEAVNIQKGDGNSFIASAISEGVVLKQSRFQEGEHFEFRAGLLELKRENIEHTES